MKRNKAILFKNLGYCVLVRVVVDMKTFTNEHTLTIGDDQTNILDSRIYSERIEKVSVII